MTYQPFNLFTSPPAAPNVIPNQVLHLQSNSVSVRYHICPRQDITWIGEGQGLGSTKEKPNSSHQDEPG